MDYTIGQTYSFCQQGQRSNQEDARYPDTDRPDTTQHCWVVCDGVGGCDKGEVASRTVADAIGNAMRRYPRESPFAEADFGQVLGEAYSALWDASNESNKDMATTLTFAVAHAGGLFVAHIGDSRIYHLRPGVGILYRSDDHSLVNSLVHVGSLTPDEAIDHPRSNVITRCMSADATVENADGATCKQIADLMEGDYLLLCTDGVLHQLDDKDLLELFSTDSSDEHKMQQLADLSRDSSDNNTATLIPIASIRHEDVLVEARPDEALDGEPEPASQETTKLTPDPSWLTREVTPAQVEKPSWWQRLWHRK